MNYIRWSKNLRAVKDQRNYLLCFNVLLSGLLVVCLFIIWHLGNEHEITLIPAGATQNMTIGSNAVDNSYLTQWAEFIVSLKMNVTPSTVAETQEKLLAYVSPSVYGAYKEQLLNEQQAIKKSEITSVFFPKQTLVDDKVAYQVKTTGELQVYYGRERAKSDQVTYQLNFNFNNGRLLLKSIKEVKNNA